MKKDMKYFILQQDRRIEGQPTLKSCPDYIVPDEWIDGKTMAVPETPIPMVLAGASGDYRGCIIEGPVTLFHHRFIEELKRCGVENIQTFPVNLQNPEGEIETRYSLINILSLVEAVDVSKSVIEKRPMSRGRLKSFVIDPQLARGQRLFRLSEKPTLIIIDETLKDQLEQDYNPPGVLLLPTERFDGWG